MANNSRYAPTHQTPEPVYFDDVDPAEYPDPGKFQREQRLRDKRSRDRDKRDRRDNWRS